MQNSILSVFPAELAEQSFEIAAVIRVSKNKKGLGLDRRAIRLARGLTAVMVDTVLRATMAPDLSSGVAIARL